MGFIRTLSVTFPADMAYSGAVDDDFNREAAFMKQAKTGVSMALPRLHKLKVPIFRPDDYFAEMAKSDSHMHKVRRRLLDIQKTGEKKEERMRIRTEKKFAGEVQKAYKVKKSKEKQAIKETARKLKRKYKQDK